MPPPLHRIESGKNLLVDKVAGGPEEDEGVGVRNAHELLTHFATFSRCPPNQVQGLLLYAVPIPSVALDVQRVSIPDAPKAIEFLCIGPHP